MPLFVIQIETGREEEFIKQGEIYSGPAEFKLHWLRRILKIRKRGIVKEIASSIYPGYLFLETSEFSKEIYSAVKKFKGFTRFLKNNHDICPLDDADLDIVNHFLRHGDLIGISEVKFDENQKIIVLKGPLKGMEGRIVKVDRRKERIKVKLEMYENSFLVDFAFTDLSEKKEDQ